MPDTDTQDCCSSSYEHKPGSFRFKIAIPPFGQHTVNLNSTDPQDFCNSSYEHKPGSFRFKIAIPPIGQNTVNLNSIIFINWM